MNNYNPWLNRANELLDLSNESRDNQAGGLGEEGGFIPQILMNPWDPQQVNCQHLGEAVKTIDFGDRGYFPLGRREVDRWHYFFFFKGL